MSEVDAVIETRDIAVKAKCPSCGADIRWAIECFDICDLWYGQEHIVCDECQEEFRIASVERDCF